MMMHPISPTKVQIDTEQRVYDGFFKVNRVRFQHERFDGSMSKTLTQEVTDRGNAVAALLYDPEEDSFVMVEQFRIGALYGNKHPWQLEVIAGKIDEGETPINAINREALEETGAAIKNVVHIQDYLTSCGGSNEVLSLYFGHIDSKAVDYYTGIGGEDIRVHVVSRETAFKMLQNGEFEGGMTIICLQWFFLQRMK